MSTSPLLKTSTDSRRRPRSLKNEKADNSPTGEVVDARALFEKKAAATKQSPPAKKKKAKTKSRKAKPLDPVIELPVKEDQRRVQEERVHQAEIPTHSATETVASAAEIPTVVTPSPPASFHEQPEISQPTAPSVSSIKTGSRAIITCRENRFDHWSESATLTVVSRFGASFSLEHECMLGRIIGLCVTQDSGFGRVREPITTACLVQQCTRIVVDGKTGYHISVIFIGKSIPRSFEMDPTQTYMVCGTDKNGFFRVEKAGTPFKQRLHPRFRIKFDIELKLIRASDMSRIAANGVTSDVSASGISVIAPLEAQRGDKIKVACRDIDFFAIAVVRNRRTLLGNESMLHLEFVEAIFPIQRVLQGPGEQPKGILFGAEIVMGNEG